MISICNEAAGQFEKIRLFREQKPTAIFNCSMQASEMIRDIPINNEALSLRHTVLCLEKINANSRLSQNRILHLADAFIQRDLQLIRLSRRPTPWSNVGLRALLKSPAAMQIVASPGIEPPTLRVQVKLLNRYTIGCPLGLQPQEQRKCGMVNQQ